MVQAMSTLTIQLPDALKGELTLAARRSGKTPAGFVRATLEQRLQPGRARARSRASLYELSRDLCGSVTGGPPDLARNKNHLKGYGSWKTVMVDAGPLVAYLKRDDADHVWAKENFQRLTAPLLTCDAVLGEVVFLLQQTHGGTRQLTELLESGLVVPAFDLAGELPAVGELLRKYESVPISLADACLVRMAELHRDAVVFTLDGDFRTR